MVKKYIFLELEITNGEYNYDSKSVHEVEEDEDIDAFADEYASTFYGTAADEYNEGYAFYGWEVYVRVSSIKIISKEHYEVLKQYL